MQTRQVFQTTPIAKKTSQGRKQDPREKRKSSLKIPGWLVYKLVQFQAVILIRKIHICKMSVTRWKTFMHRVLCLIASMHPIQCDVLKTGILLKMKMQLQETRLNKIENYNEHFPLFSYSAHYTCSYLILATCVHTLDDSLLLRKSWGQDLQVSGLKLFHWSWPGEGIVQNWWHF